MKKVLYLFLLLSFILFLVKKKKGALIQSQKIIIQMQNQMTALVNLVFEGGVWDVHYIERSLIINNDTLLFDSGHPSFGEPSSFEFIGDVLYVEKIEFSQDTTNWSIIGDSLYIEGGEEVFKYTVSKTDLELQGVIEDIFVSPADFIIRAMR